MKKWFIVLLLVSQAAGASSYYNFGVDFQKFPEVSGLKNSNFKGKVGVVTIYQVEGDLELVKQFADRKITQILFDSFELEIKNVQGDYYFDSTQINDGKFSFLMDGSSPQLFEVTNCKQFEIEQSFRQIKSDHFIVQKLIKGCEKKVTITYGYTFFKKKSVTKAEFKKDFLYMLDQKYQAPFKWDSKKVEFVIAGDEAFTSAVEGFLQTYKSLLSKSIEITFSKAKECDWINSEVHCIFLYDSKEEKKDQEVHFAVTHVLANPVTGAIIDADIALRKKDFETWKLILGKMISDQISKTPQKKELLEQYMKTKIDNYFQNIVTHEFGHALGLAHNFSDKNPSIMGYNQLTTLSEYDQEALRALYKLPRQFKSTNYELLKTPSN